MILPYTDPRGFPSFDRVVLPSAAFLGSWRNQTLPARSAALEDALEHARETATADRDCHDMALLGVIAEAMQSLEDLAYLGTAWDEPFGNLAHYLRATTYSSRTPTNFWGSAHRWSDERLEVFAGFRGRTPDRQTSESVIDSVPTAAMLDHKVLAAMDRARVATVERLRRLLAGLGKDWRQFSPYYQAFKHGGLVIRRDDVAWVEDHVAKLTADTPRHQPSVAVWARRPKATEAYGDFNLDAKELADYAAGTGRLAIDLTDAFVESRLSLFDAFVFDDGGKLSGLRPLQFKWTIWLREQDLDQATWEVLGQGPRMVWESGESVPPTSP